MTDPPLADDPFEDDPFAAFLDELRRPYRLPMPDLTRLDTPQGIADERARIQGAFLVRRAARQAEEEAIAQADRYLDLGFD